MLSICLKPFLHPVIVLTTVASLAPGLTGSARHDGPQTAPALQILSAIMEDVAATLVFQQRVSNYVALHRLLEGPVPTPQVSTDMRTVRIAMDALAARIQTARKDARQGDIFTDDVARMFHRRITSCLAREEINAILADQRYGVNQATPHVNAVWPVTVPFDFVPPQLLATLPALPPELQYRIIGRSLVLWDHHANLIVAFCRGPWLRKESREVLAGTRTAVVIVEGDMTNRCGRLIGGSIALLVTPLLGAVIASDALPRAATVERVVRITVVARDFTFTPSRIVVEQGDLVKITLVATDMPHSLSIDEYRVAKKSNPGTEAVIEFCAQTRGTFTFYCSLTDDPRCRGMKGQLVVR